MRRCNSCEKCSDCKKSETRSKASLLIRIAPSSACSASIFWGAARCGASGERASSRLENCSTVAMLLRIDFEETRTPTQHARRRGKLRPPADKDRCHASNLPSCKGARVDASLGAAFVPNMLSGCLFVGEGDRRRLTVAPASEALADNAFPLFPGGQ